MDHNHSNTIDFSNTEIAYAYKSDARLRKTYRLFKLMKNPKLVNIANKLALFASRTKIPFSDAIIRSTVFDLFCGGESLLDSQESIDELSAQGVMTVLDYGAEGKNTSFDLDETMQELLLAVQFAASNIHVPVVVVKLSGIAQDSLLAALSSGKDLTEEQQTQKQDLLHRFDSICSLADDLKVRLFLDAEQSWYQGAIDELALAMMRKYNHREPTVYHTFQMYRKDKLLYLKELIHLSREEGFILGVKLVRGAYMETERQRAKKMGYPSPIHDTKADTDASFNSGIELCVQSLEHVAFCNATHNLESSAKLVNLINANNAIKADNPYINFCQLYGMSDFLTMNLAAAGYNASKYLVYGTIKEVVPYLIRRAQENTSVTGEMGRELTMIYNEMKRRNLK